MSPDRSSSLADLVAALLEHKRPVSGQRLAERFGITRAALQKRVSKLKQLGFEISARPRAGYHLLRLPDRLIEETVAPFLETRWLGRTVAAHKACDSTNDEALKSALAGGPTGLVVFAETQRTGRGRLGRQWHSPPGANIYLSALLRPTLPPPAMSCFTLATAVAVAEAIRDQTGTVPLLKWPNDLMLDTRKTCGILTEMSAEADAVHALVVGVGCNVNIEAFPAELEDIATSLKLATGRTVDRANLAAAILNRLEHWHDRYLEHGPEKVIQAWKDWPNVLGRTVTVSQAGRPAKITGLAADLDHDGALLLELPEGGKERVLSGDVKLFVTS